jgi:hypothetical protein
LVIPYLVKQAAEYRTLTVISVVHITRNQKAGSSRNEDEGDTGGCVVGCERRVFVCAARVKSRGATSETLFETAAVARLSAPGAFGSLETVTPFHSNR